MERQVFGGELHSGRPARPLWAAMLNGMRGRCPQCGEGRLFRSFSKTVPVCEHCGLEIHHHRADDFPAYIVILIVGHITIGGMLAVEVTTNLPMWMHLAIWAPLTVILAIGLLQPVKGAIVGLQWALYMHGFGGEEPALETHPDL
ncbi:MAG TPA: DUF983 domain-containing protein [Rhizobiaceae bacterium]|nr:DUF983 domain-containing protein [Rhizobiaceae bacterium]